jgi:hypothetical protein
MGCRSRGNGHATHHFASSSRGEADTRRAAALPLSASSLSELVEKGGTSGHRYLSPGLETLFDFWPGFLLRILLRVFLPDNPEIAFANTRSRGRLNGHPMWAE